MDTNAIDKQILFTLNNKYDVTFDLLVECMKPYIDDARVIAARVLALEAMNVVSFSKPGDKDKYIIVPDYEFINYRHMLDEKEPNTLKSIDYYKALLRLHKWARKRAGLVEESELVFIYNNVKMKTVNFMCKERGHEMLQEAFSFYLRGKHYVPSFVEDQGTTELKERLGNKKAILVREVNKKILIAILQDEEKRCEGESTGLLNYISNKAEPKNIAAFTVSCRIANGFHNVDATTTSDNMVVFHYLTSHSDYKNMVYSNNYEYYSHHYIDETDELHT